MVLAWLDLGFSHLQAAELQGIIFLNLQKNDQLFKPLYPFFLFEPFRARGKI
jgi:hypothetical protein